MITAYISLGGNQGNVPHTFERTLAIIETWSYITVQAVSAIYRTEPQGDSSQPWFCNQVAALSCDDVITPQRLLRDLQKLETKFGRIRIPERPFGPRTIDLDILLFGDILLTGRELLIPHPRMAERAFVLVPLLDIAPNLVLPGNGRLDALLAQLTYKIKGLMIHQTSPQST